MDTSDIGAMNRLLPAYVETAGSEGASSAQAGAVTSCHSQTPIPHEFRRSSMMIISSCTMSLVYSWLHATMKMSFTLPEGLHFLTERGVAGLPRMGWTHAPEGAW